MKKYRVKPEYYDYWVIDDIENNTVTEEEVKHLANEWGKSFDDLLEQLEEV